MEELDPDEGLRAICGVAGNEDAFDERLRTLLPRGDTSATACAAYWRDLQ